jgi:hypothetical protein
LGDFTGKSDKEHTESDIGDRCAATTVQQRQDKTKDPPVKWTSAIHFKALEEISSPTGSVHYLPVGSDEKIYLFLFV